MAERRPLVMGPAGIQELPIGDTVPMSTSRIWVGGPTIYSQGETVTSSSDWESYRRIAATGTDTIDPALETSSFKYIATSYNRVTAIGPESIYGSGGSPGLFAGNATQVAPGVIAVGVRANVLSLTGRGDLMFMGIAAFTFSPGRLEVEIDDRSVFNRVLTPATSSSASVILGTCSSGISGGTTYPAYTANGDGQGVSFRRKLQVFYTPGSEATNASSRLAYSVRPRA